MWDLGLVGKIESLVGKQTELVVNFKDLVGIITNLVGIVICWMNYYRCLAPVIIPKVERIC